MIDYTTRLLYMVGRMYIGIQRRALHGMALGVKFRYNQTYIRLIVHMSNVCCWLRYDCANACTSIYLNIFT